MTGMTETKVKAVFLAHTWMCAKLYTTFKNIECVRKYSRIKAQIFYSRIKA